MQRTNALSIPIRERLHSKSPKVGAPIKLIHHSDGHFFTYDQGYVKRHADFMEISVDFSPGGSGCGVFDSDWRLIGLVSSLSQQADRGVVNGAVSHEAIVKITGGSNPQSLWKLWSGGDR